MISRASVASGTDDKTTQTLAAQLKKVSRVVYKTVHSGQFQAEDPIDTPATTVEWKCHNHGKFTKHLEELLRADRDVHRTCLALGIKL